MSFEQISIIILLAFCIGGFSYLFFIISKLREHINKLLNTTTNRVVDPPLSNLSNPSVPENIQDTTSSELKSKVALLEQQLALYKRQDVGVVLTWLPTKQDSMAYVLEVYNDTPEKIFNVQVHIEPTYQQCTNIFGLFDKCDAQKSIEISFVPGGWAANPKNAENINRNNFLELWLQEKLKPIKFTVMYTTTPRKQDFKILEIDFKKEQAAKHMKTRLRQLKTKSNLTLLSSDEEAELN